MKGSDSRNKRGTRGAQVSLHAQFLGHAFAERFIQYANDNLKWVDTVSRKQTDMGDQILFSLQQADRVQLVGHQGFLRAANQT
jgi:hypothetical protein